MHDLIKENAARLRTPRSSNNTVNTFANSYNNCFKSI